MTYCPSGNAQSVPWAWTFLIWRPGIKLLLGPRFFLLRRNLSSSWLQSEFFVLLKLVNHVLPGQPYPWLICSPRGVVGLPPTKAYWGESLGLERLMHTAGAVLAGDLFLSMSKVLFQPASLCWVFLSISEPIENAVGCYLRGPISKWWESSPGIGSWNLPVWQTWNLLFFF